MSDTTGPASIVDGIPDTGRKHCESTALGVLLGHEGLDLSEPMIFGLGSGLSFIYWDSKNQAFPFLGGRVKPFALTQNLTGRLGLHLQVRETTSPRKAWDQVRAAIDMGTPVGLQLDSHELEYFGSRVHFAGHIAVLYGYDDTTAYLIDTAQQGGRVTTSLDSLARARAARGPMSAPHRSFTVTVPATESCTPARLVPAVTAAITECAETFLSPPIINLGNRGIRKASQRIPAWFERIEQPSRDLPVIATLMERAGTGGALFRTLYRDFLTECRDLFELCSSTRNVDLAERGRRQFTESALLWTQVATLIDRAGSTTDPEQLNLAGQLLEHIATIETSAMTTLASLDNCPTPGPA